MITTGAKLWFAIAFAAVAGMLAYFVATGRGDDGGTFVLATIAAGCAVLGAASLVSRDGDATIDPEAAVEDVRIRSSLPAFWPALGAVGAGVAIIGYAAGGLLLYVGLGIIGAVVAEWMVQGWAERSTSDPAYNQALRNRIMFPFEVPVLGLAGLALVMITFSRVLLAVSKTGSTVVAIVVAAVILAIGSVVATRPKIPAGALTWVVVLGAVALLTGGVVSGLAGERHIEVHHADEGEHHEDEGGGQAGGGEGNAGGNTAGDGTIGDDGSHDSVEGAGDDEGTTEEESGTGDDNTEVQTP
ncbi:MAG TPA: hypothetical protein VEA78_01405 [Acidimicrobiales bacterium]|nr:hypothetical protein [Acidimicrobiales bacterium]